MKTFSLMSSLLFFFHLNAQTNFEVKVNGIKQGDSIRVILKKSSELLLQKWVSNKNNQNQILSFKTFIIILVQKTPEVLQTT